MQELRERFQELRERFDEPTQIVMAGLVPAIHVFFADELQRRGWPE
jgi:hypothetical protein